MKNLKRRPTISDIARSSGVSLSTVSLVMNHNPRISEATRERVQKTMQRLGYQPNRQARALASQRSHTLAVLLAPLRPPLAHAYFGGNNSGIHRKNRHLRYQRL